MSKKWIHCDGLSTKADATVFRFEFHTLFLRLKVYPTAVSQKSFLILTAAA